VRDFQVATGAGLSDGQRGYPISALDFALLAQAIAENLRLPGRYLNGSIYKKHI